MKLSLENLTERILPSASPVVPPPVVDVTSQMVSAMDQWSHLIVTLQNEISSIQNAIIQEIAQETAYVERQWDHLLGNIFNVPTQSAAAVQQSGSGSGSGSGAMTTAHNAPNQPLKIAAPQSGSGSGSGATTTIHENASQRRVMLLAGSGSCGSGSGSTPEVSFTLGSNPFPEESGSCANYATRDVLLSGSTCHTVTVDYTTVDGSAIAGTDYTAESGTLTFAPGQTGQIIKIPILDDGTDESAGSESFQVILSNPSGATLGTPSSTEIDIAEGPPQGDTDTLVWNPHCSNNYSAVASNWYDLTQQRQLENGDPGPESGTPIVFDGTPDSLTSKNAAIDWTQSVTVDSITLQNGYNAQQTIEDNITLTTDGFQDNNVGLDNFLVAFAGAGADLNFGPGQDVMGDFEWKAGGQTNVNGGNVTIGNGAGLDQSTASPININSGVVSIGPNTAGATSTFNLTNANANILVNANGLLDFYAPPAADTLVDNNKAGAQIVNNGTTYLVGNGSGAKATIDAPFVNHGIFNADTGGIWYFHTADNFGNDLSMDQGKIFLMGGVSITCQHAYTQTGGTLEIGDTQNETFWAELGNLNFNGGKIVFSASNGFGTLEVPKVVFNGVEIDMRIAGSNSSSDQIRAESMTTTIKGNSKLVVTATSPVQKGITWTLIKLDAGNTITGDFNAANITLPANVVETAGALPNSWQCNS